MTGFSFAAFASLRLGENRSLNKEAHLSQRREGAAIYFGNCSAFIPGTSFNAFL